MRLLLRGSTVLVGHAQQPKFYSQIACYLVIVGMGVGDCTSEVLDTYKQHCDSQFTMWYMPFHATMTAEFKAQKMT